MNFLRKTNYIANKFKIELYLLLLNPEALLMIDNTV